MNTCAERKHPEPQIEVQVLDRWQMAVDYMNLHRQPIPMLPLDRRTGMTEVELCYTEQEAMAEAQRCLKCYVNTILEGSEQDGTDCVLCGGCVDVCPENCLELVPLDRIAVRAGHALMRSRTIPSCSASSWKTYSRRN